MKQVINRKGKVSVREVPAPACGPGEVKVSVTHSLISSGTERMTLKVTGRNLVSRAKDRPDLVKKVVERARSQGVAAAVRAVREKVNEPKPMGYSATGVVVEVGAQVTDTAPGDRVACGGATAGHAGVICVPSNLVVGVPPEVEPECAAFTTLGSIAMQGVRRAQLELGDRVVVLGLGLVGQLCVQLARRAGARVLGLDPLRERVDLALSLGAEGAYSLSDGDAAGRVLDFTRGVGADAVIVAAGTDSSDPINQAVSFARERGRISIVGITGLDMRHTPFYMKELDLHMSRSYGPGRYDMNYEELGVDYPIAFVRWTENRNMGEVLRLMAQGELRVKPLISEVVPIEEAERAYGELTGRNSGALAIVLEYGPQEEGAPAAVGAPGPSRVRKGGGAVRVAVVGCGGFCTKERLPYLRRSPHFEIVSLVSRTGAKVEELASQYGVGHSGTDYAEMLEREDVDLVLVAAPNSVHGPLAIDAARAGKDLFVEKPMAVDAGELEAVREAVLEAGVQYACGFNRRYAPASVKLKEGLGQHEKPWNVVYRCNVGLTPPGHPMHPPAEGGGLIVGEACHFFDYCSWLVDARPVTVSATMPSYDGASFVGSDNLSSVVKYDDGSVATIVYTTMGHTGLAKERVEVYAGGVCAVLDDYVSLTFHGAKHAGWSGTQDKGHKAVVAELGRALAAGEDVPIGLEASYAGHVLTFGALESARTGATVHLR